MRDRLLELLRHHANGRGIALIREAAILDTLRIPADQLAEPLAELEKLDEIEILSPRPFLVIRLRKWSGKGGNPPISGTPAYSYPKQLLQTKRLNNSYRPAAPPATDELLQEILETLGETDAHSFEKAVELYSPHVIRTALRRVRQARGIRKSRTALFRHLLPRLARESHLNE